MLDLLRNAEDVDVASAVDSAVDSLLTDGLNILLDLKAAAQVHGVTRGEYVERLHVLVDPYRA